MMDSTFRYLSVCALCLGLFISVLTGQGEFHYGSGYGERIGLFAAPTSMVEDKYGFYWVATREGLFRLDGTRAVELDIFSKLGKSDKWIYGLDYDPVKDRLLLAGRAGILSYDLESGQMSEVDMSGFRKGENRVSQISESILVDRQGDLWAGIHQAGIIRVPLGKDTILQYHLTSDQISSSNPSLLSLCNTVVELVQDPADDDIIWAGTRHGLIRISKRTHEVRHFEYNSGSQALDMASNPMRKIYPHANGRLYIGTWNGGVLEFDPVTGSFSQTLLEYPFEENLLTNQVRRIIPGPGSGLFVSGSGNRLFLYDTRTRQIQLYKTNAGADLIDSRGHYWQISDDELRCFHKLSNSADRVFYPEKYPVLELRSATPGIRETEEIWVKGKMKGGVLQYDGSTSAWNFFRVGKDDQKLVDGNVVHDTPLGVLINDDEDLYIKRPGNQLFDKMPYRLDDEGDPFKSVVSTSWDVFISGRDGYFYWLHSGLSKMERYTTRDISAPYEGFFSESTVSAVDEFGRAWIHSAGGYSVFDPARKSFSHYKLQEDQSGVDLMIRDMSPDNEGRMWFTTVNAVGYFHTAEPETGIRRIFSTAHGYDFNNVWYVSVDDKGRPWIVEREGLVCLDPASGKVFQTGMYAYSIETASNGELIVGGRNSFAIFHPDSLLVQINELPQPYVCWVQSGQTNTFIGADPLTPKEIRIGPDDNAFSLAFSALYLHKPGRVKWSYRLSGLEKDWHFPENYQSIVNYSGLRPGKYVFQLNATDMFGNAGPPYRLTIRVAPPWYRTKVSKAFFSAAILGLLGFFVFSGRRRYLLQLSLIRERSESSRLLELDRFKSKVFTNITHEIRTPLTIILGQAENLGKAKDKKVAEAASRITENGNALLEHINQMLNLARLDAGKIDLNPVRNDVVLFIRMTVQRFRPMAQAKNIHIGFHPEPDSFQFDYDPNYFGQVLSNLLGNAIKFSRAHGEVQVLFRGGETQIEVVVKDSGPGIHPDDLPRIFERFYTANHSLRISEGSSGIGLSLSNELIQLMGGRIDVKSAQGKGSSFCVILPVLEASSPVFAGVTAQHDTDIFIPKGLFETNDISEDEDARPLILVVEDNPELAEYIRSIFSPEFRVSLAVSGKSGLESAIANLPEVIISDIMMPEMDGIEFCRQLKSDMRTSHIPLIFLTAKVGAESRMEGIRAGAFGFLEKPFIQEELRLSVENALLFRQRIKEYLSHTFAGEKSPDPVSMQESKVVSGERVFLEKLNSVIEGGIADEDFDITRLCRAMGMSRAQLYRKLSSLTGVSVAIYIRNIRLEKARDLLLRTDQNVSQIAYAVGFSDPNYFSKVYHERYGQSPSETRKS